MKKYLLYALTLVLTSAIWATAQAPDPVLTNEDVIKMSKMGLSATIIISKIKASEVNFKTELTDLKALAAENVPDEVVAAMIERQAVKPTPKKTVVYSPANAEYGNLSEIKGKTKVFLAIEDAPSRKIVADAIAKQRSLSIVNSRSEADFAVSFTIGRVDAGSNSLLRTAHNVIVVGELWAYTYLPVKDEDVTGRVRILWQKRKTQDWSGGLTFNRHPAVNAVNDFLKDWKKLK